MRMRRSYTSGEVLQFTGATMRQLDYWATHDYVTPSVKDSRGTGHHRRWSWADIELIWALLWLARHVGHVTTTAAVVALSDHIDGHHLAGDVEIGPGVWVDLGRVAAGLEHRLRGDTLEEEVA